MCVCWDAMERSPRRERVVHDEIDKVVSDQTGKDSVGHRERFLDFIFSAVRIYWRI